MDKLLESIKAYLQDERVLIGVTAVAVGVTLKYIFTKRRNLPPGPGVWPVVGSLPYLRDDLDVFIEFAEKYGDLYFLQLGLFGQAPAIVINNMDLAREALLQKQDEFAGRFRSPTFNIISNNGKDIVFGDYGPEWRYQRKIAHMALRKYAFGHHFQELLGRNVEMISDIFAKGGDEPQDIFFNSSLLFYNIVSSFCFGKNYSMDDSEFLHVKQMIDDLNDTFTGFFLADLLPILRHIPTPGTSAFKGIAKELHGFLDNVIAEHKENFDENNLRDLTDYIIHSEIEMQASGLEEYKVQLSDVHYRLILFDMFAGAVDTSRNTLTWALMFMATHPEIQKRAQQEIDEKIGRNGKIDGQSRTKIPFCEAIIYETLRLRAPTPMGLPHCVTMDTTLGGYDIPKGTLVMFHLRRIHSDPREWKDPGIFNPQRFLDEGGNLAPKPNGFLPFSAGKRSCVGEALAKSELHIMIGNLLQRFTFSAPEGVKLDLRPKPSLIIFVPRDPHLVVKPR